MQSLVGQFLISMPRLHGGLFGDTLIYLWSHDEHGAQGLVVNREHELTLTKLLHQLEIPSRLSHDVNVVDGGPVEPRRGFILHTDDVRVDSSEKAGAGLAMSCSRDILEFIASQRGPDRFLVALGYAGWGPGQLEDELTGSAWLTAPSSQEMLFDVPIGQRLDGVAALLGIDLNLLGADAGYA